MLAFDSNVDVNRVQLDAVADQLCGFRCDERGAGSHERLIDRLSVLIHSPDEVVHLAPPSAAEYEAWAIRFLTEASIHLGPKVDLLSDPELCAQIAAVLRERFEQIPDTEKLLRNWTKMVGLPAAVLLSQSGTVGHNELVAIIADAARQISGEVMPWDE